MRKQLLFIFFTLSILAACKKEDNNVFGNSPDARLNDTLQKYQAILTGAEHGWKGLIFPDGMPHSIFAFYFKFNDSNRVQMYADYDSTSAVTMKESSYRLKALQQPSLLFDTYSYIHLLSDPDAAVNGGVYGEGLYSDFEFSMDGVSGDTIKLTGRFHGSKAYMIKATAEEEAAYNNKTSTRLIDNIDKYLTYFKKLTTGGINYDIAFSIATRSARFSWIDADGKEHVEITGFYYTPDGVAFYPAVNGITAFNNISWSASTTTLSFTINGTAGTIKETNKPIIVDKTAAKTWYNLAADQATYWVSYDGFHVDGVDDYYGIHQLPNYYFLVYYPKYSTSGGVLYDLLGFVTNDGSGATLEYGPAFSPPTFTTDGRIIFPYLGDLGTYPDDPAAIENTITKISESNGYYLVQTGTNAFDMVSAKDGRAWISWIY